MMTKSLMTVAIVDARSKLRISRLHAVDQLDGELEDRARFQHWEIGDGGIEPRIRSPGRSARRWDPRSRTGPRRRDP